MVEECAACRYNGGEHESAPEGLNPLPLYAYRCTQCGHRFEKIQRFNAEPEKVCPKCGGPAERVLTAPGLQFKGAGWYVNDYAPKSSAPAGEPAPQEAKKDAKTETKPSAGTDSSGSNSSPSTPPPPPGPSAS
jgi:putative FmdB family regulatory protein